MNAKYLVVHTYLYLRNTKEYNRPGWRSIVTEYPEWILAHSKMREDFAASVKSGVCVATFDCDSAYIETETGEKEIWTITQWKEG